jgi:dienelactone hydrolase
LFSPLKTWLRAGHYPHRAASFRPTVEGLEDRCLLAASALDPTSEVLSGGVSPVSSSPGTFDPSTGTWYLRSSNSPGTFNAGTFAYGAPGWIPVVGEWDGKGTTTIGVVDPTTETWYLKTSNQGGAPDIMPFQYGAPGWIPVVGDWTGTGHWGIGVFDPATATWYLKNTADAGASDLKPFQYGGTNWTPVVGDWDGNGTFTIGAVDPNNTWYLKNSNRPGAADIPPFTYGIPGWTPMVGKWEGDGKWTVGVVDPSTGQRYLRNSNSAGAPDVPPFAFGAPAWTPLAGIWPFPATPWNLAELRLPPAVTWVDTTGPLRRLYYPSEPYKGHSTTVFAYYAEPPGDGKVPAVVLVHGGGGMAFPEWAKQWADRGYAALAMDLFGNGPDGNPLPDAGPPFTSTFPPTPTAANDTWPYYAVATVIRGVSLLSNLPRVDPNRIGIMGISWGGYLTCIVTGLDDRLKAAVSVYGCGYLHQDSAWTATLDALPAAWRSQWIANYDPASYLGRVNVPFLFVTGANDAAYYLDIFQESTRLVDSRQLSVRTDLVHSHQAAWATVEPGLFMDQYLLGGQPLPLLATTVELVDAPPPPLDSSQATTVLVGSSYRTDVPIAKAQVCWTTDTGAWPDRSWHSAPATLEELSSGSWVVGEVPAGPSVTCFLCLTDSRGATVSTEYKVVGEP